MQTFLCFSVEDALKQVMHAIGGHKVVGVKLRPELEKDPDAAGRWFLNCINPDREEKLSLTQLLAVLRWGHAAGCHMAMDFINRDCGYAEPIPITPEDQEDELMREFIASVKVQAENTARLERLQGLITQKRSNMRKVA